MKKLFFVFGVVLFSTFMLSGCTHLETGASVKLNKSERWVILPLQNLAETPRASERVESVLQTLLARKGIRSMAISPQGAAEDLALLLDDAKRLETAKTRAREEGFRFGITGAVQEWHYKTGLDGEPAVGITLTLVDLKSNDAVLWTATASRTGWGSENLSTTTVKVLNALIGDMEF